MLSLPLIQRHLDARHDAQLIHALAANGQLLPLPLRARLSHPAPATGLGLRRAAELTYGPCPLLAHAARHLIDAQRPDGAFDGSCDRDPLATAGAAAGLAAARDLVGPDLRPLAADAHHHAVLALASMQRPGSPPLFPCPDDRQLEDRALVAAFILHLLADDPDFRQTARVGELITWLDEHAHRLGSATATLLRLVHAGQHTTRHAPALAA